MATTNQKIFKDNSGDKLKISRDRKIHKVIYIDGDMGFLEYDLDVAKQFTEHLLRLIKQQDPNYNPTIGNMNIDFKGEWITD